MDLKFDFFKMNKLRTISRYFINAVLSAVLLGCSAKQSNPTTASTWVIVKVEHMNRSLSYYRAVTTDTTDLNTQNTWFVDTTGKFELGDTVQFSHSR